jgi:hypothetical protein
MDLLREEKYIKKILKICLKKETKNQIAHPFNSLKWET